MNKLEGWEGQALFAAYHPAVFVLLCFDPNSRNEICSNSETHFAL